MTKFGERRFYGDPKDVKPHPKRKRKSMYDIVNDDLKKMPNNPDARKSGFDVRNGDVKILTPDGKLKKIIKNKAQYKQKNSSPWRNWNTVK